MRQVSKKRARENRERRRVILDRYGRFPRCYGCQPLAELGIVTGCNGWADDAHEILSRARGGSITDPDNILPLGRLCHSYITTHPRDAERAGLSRSAGPRTDTPYRWECDACGKVGYAATSDEAAALVGLGGHPCVSAGPRSIP